MKVLFLDVDGVLNRCGKSGHGLEQDKVELLRRILITTGCRIVLSSTWRMFEHQRKRIEMLCEMDLNTELYGCTPVQARSSGGLYTGDTRGREIMAWLEQHPEVTHCAILDDDNDMGPLAHHLILTDSYTGLTEEKALQVFAHLTSPSSSVLTTSPASALLPTAN